MNFFKHTNLKMHFLLTVTCLLCFDQILAEETSVQQYCADLQVQEHIDVKKLTGMWFVVEVVSHRREVTPTPDYEESCAVVSISDKLYADLSPIYTDYKYNQSYGPNYPIYDQHETRTERPRNYQYRTISRNDLYKDPKYRQEIYKKQQERKPIKITWDEKGSTITYAAYYTYPVGIWYIYPPDIALIPDGYPQRGVSDHLVGMIQVLKAVGSHMVLSFCQRLPEEKLFTAVLSRTPQLDIGELTGILSLIRRKELETFSKKRMCSLNSSTRFSINFVFVLSFTYVLL